MKPTETLPVIGMDIAKNVFQLHVVDAETGEIERHKLRRDRVTICKRTAIPPRPYDKAVPHLRMRYQVGCQWCGSNSPIWLARCMGRRAITSRR